MVGFELATTLTAMLMCMPLLKKIWKDRSTLSLCHNVRMVGSVSTPQHVDDEKFVDRYEVEAKG